MTQAQAFLNFCGDWWHDHNPHGVENDPVLQVIEGMEYPFKNFLEIGCGTGWRLKKLREKYNAVAVGIEPSKKAAAFDEDYIARATAETLPFKNGVVFDCIIYGFCLTWVDPDDYFRVASEGNRVLQDGGFIIIHDRLSPRPIKHHYITLDNKDGRRVASIYFHELDFSKFWLAHPYYVLHAEYYNYEKREAVIVLRKQVQGAFTMVDTGPATVQNL